MDYSSYDISLNINTPGGSNERFINIATDSSFNDVFTDPSGRKGERLVSSLSNNNYRVFQSTDISINYVDLSWNFYVAVDTSRNFWQGYPITQSDGSIRNPIIHIYDISHNGRSDTDPSLNQYVPKLYDSSGGSSFAFNDITILLTYDNSGNNYNNGFTYSPQLYDPVEVLPVIGGGGGGTDASGGTGGGGSGISGEIIIDICNNQANIAIIDNSLNLWFFDPPKAITNGVIELDTTSIPPRLDCSWNNPSQRRAAFDFIGVEGPSGDLIPIGNQNRDDYNFLPYFQGIRCEFILYDSAGLVLGSGQSWTHMVPVASITAADYWLDKTFLPRSIKNIFVYNSNATGVTFGITSSFNSLLFKLPTTFGGANTPGAKVRLRISMVNRARATINDPSYVEHNTSQDVSWNWVYIPETGGLAIGNYGTPTPPLKLLSTSTLYNQFTLSGRNDNSGNDIICIPSTQAIVETELSTLFTSLSASNPSLPKVRYRYDISGHRLSSSKQVGGNEALIDISVNVPDTDVSANWYPSTTNPSSDPNSWTDTQVAGTVVYPQHKYEYTGYSMRYNLDPSANNDASLNSVWQGASSWNTTYPTRAECTQTAPSGYRSSLTNTTIPPSWTEASSSTPAWTYGQYFVTSGAIEAWLSSNTIKTGLLFLNDGNEPGTEFIATTIKVDYPNPFLLRANDTQTAGSEWFVGLDTSGQEIIRMRSAILLDDSPTYPSYTTDTDLSGVQKGFVADISSVATDPSNNYLSWTTTALVNAYDLGDISRNGGYYCGTNLGNIKIKNVNLINYQDISNNIPDADGYKFAIWQELNDGSGNWIAYPDVSNGITKIVNIATRPVEDISFQTGFSTVRLKDGYNGTPTYIHADNKFKFGSSGIGQNPIANFFGLPMLATTSQDIIDYSLVINKLDETWWPTDNNLIGDLKLYFKGNAPGDYTNWGGQTVDKPWSGAAPFPAFPQLPRQPNGADTLTGNFDFDNTGTASFTANKYSRTLMPMTFTPSTGFPLFYINADYDNNILRLNRGGTGLEVGTLKNIDADYVATSTYKNRLVGKGVGLNGDFTLFWDNTFDTSVTFQKTGEIGSSPFDKYPFVDIGQAPDYTTSYIHTVKLSDGTIIPIGTGGDRQLIWAKDGFKPGGWGTIDEIPYIDYSGNYWFGNHTSGFTQDYSNLNTIGESLHLDARTFTDTNSGGQFFWWTGSGTGFVMNANLRLKFMVIKCPIPAMALPSGGFTGVSISTKKSGGSLQEIPFVDSGNLVTGQGSATNPIVWWQEVGNSSTHPSGSFSIAGKTGWKATHKTYNPGLTKPTNNDNNAGSLWGTGYSLGQGKIHRIWGNTSSVGVFDLYFRIGLPNQGTYDIQEMEVQFKYISSTNVATDVTGTNSTQTFTFLI